MVHVIIATDDAHDLREVSAVVGGLHGFERRIVQGHAELLEQVRRQTPDVFLLDGRLPGLDLFDFLARLPALAPRAMVVLLCAEVSVKDYQRALRLGVVDVLLKPFGEGELVDVLLRAVDSQSGFRGSLHGLSLADVLQMFHLSRRSVSVEVRGSAGVGLVSMRMGEIVHAEVGDTEGEDAMVALLSDEVGAIRSTPLRPGKTSIEGSFQGLILETFRRIDEGAQSTKSSGVFLAKPTRTSRAPPGGAGVERLKELTEGADRELAAAMLVGKRVWTLWPGNLGSERLVALGERVLRRVKVGAGKRVMWLVGEMGVAVLEGLGLPRVLLAKALTRSSDGRNFYAAVLKIERMLKGVDPQLSRLGT